MLDTNLADWNLYLHVANVAVVGVNANAPYKTLPELLAAMKAKPGQVAVATAGVTSGGHNAMEAISRATGVKYRHVTYDGGAPAVVATVGGETEVTTQLAVEQAEMIRAKRIRPLAAVSDRPVVIEGYGTIEPITKWVPGFKAATNYFGIFVPKGVPPQVTATLEKVWAQNIANNEAIRKYAASRGALFAPVAGDAAQKAAFPAVQANAWLMHEAGKTKVAPDAVGIPKP
jgi:tripartite-type tricarboxylate transporter receptor subunit TctC